MSKPKKYKITGRLVGGWTNPEGETIRVVDVEYATFEIVRFLKLLHMAFFYDHIEVAKWDSDKNEYVEVHSG